MCIKNYILPFDIFCYVSSLIDCNNNKIVCVFFSVDCRVSSINSLKKPAPLPPIMPSKNKLRRLLFSEKM